VLLPGAAKRAPLAVSLGLTGCAPGSARSPSDTLRPHSWLCCVLTAAGVSLKVRGRFSPWDAACDSAAVPQCDCDL